MSQQEIVQWLTQKRISSNDYYTASTIADELDLNERSTFRMLKQLHSYGYLDRRVRFGKPVRYRLKKEKILVKYLED